jgi:ectoine hydroxylase-related dioxygenase (phytanoyl-CoA dioxygenase family)
MTFDLSKFDQPVANSSGEFDYYENNIARLSTASNVTREAQTRPAALGHPPASDLPVLPAPGQVLLFSGAQLHATVPNTSGRSRFSIDFRTVDATDLEDRRGAPVVDARCTGTAIRDFHRITDGAPIAEDFVRRHFGAPPDGSVLVFQGAESDD